MNPPKVERIPDGVLDNIIDGVHKTMAEESITITQAQVQDAMTTYAYLARTRRAAIGRRGIAQGQKQINWDIDNQRWRWHTGGSCSQGALPSSTELNKGIAMETTHVLVHQNNDLYYHWDDTGTQDPYHLYSGTQRVDIYPAQIQDMLELFCILGDKMSAMLMRNGAVYAYESIFREDGGRISSQTGGPTFKESFNGMDFPLTDDDFNATSVIVPEYKLVMYEDQYGTRWHMRAKL